MQSYIIFYAAVPVFLIIAGTFFIASVSKRSKSYDELMEYSNCKDKAILEYRKIRHEYNNIIQTILCFIEEEDIEKLISYKPEMLGLIHKLNKNNMTELVKVTNRDLFIYIYKLLESTRKSGTNVSLTVSDNVPDNSSFLKIDYKIIDEGFKRACGFSVENPPNIEFKVIVSENGISISLQNITNMTEKELSAITVLKHDEHIFYNTYIKNSLLIQEIIFSV